MKTNKKWKMFFPIAGIIAGLALLSYPFISDLINTARNEQAVSSMISVYDRYKDNMEEIEKQRKQADLYNMRLAGQDTDEITLPYDNQMTFDGNGILGYVDIPKINLKMPIYHGTSDEVLAAGAGHVENTSLPVGGASTHSVISGHSGMREMRAFDDLRKLEKGDIIMIGALGQVLKYRVTYSETVLPEETDSLNIIYGKDLLTLVTCTPYGINDHRLLVHSERTDTDTAPADETPAVTYDQTDDSDINQIIDIRVIILIAALAGVICFICLLRRKDKTNKVPEKNM